MFLQKTNKQTNKIQEKLFTEYFFKGKINSSSFFIFHLCNVLSSEHFKHPNWKENDHSNTQLYNAVKCKMCTFVCMATEVCIYIEIIMQSGEATQCSLYSHCRFI